MSYRARHRRTRIVRAIVVLSTFALVAVTAMFLAPQRAQAATTTFLIDSLDAVAGDATPGDGSCRTAAGTCTFRAALQEANALAALPTPPGPSVIGVKPGLTGTITVLSGTPKMQASFSSGYGDTGAFFLAKAPYLTIDFDNRVGISTSGTADNAMAAGLYVDAANTVVRGFTNLVTAETSMVATANASGLVVEQMTFDSPYAGERALWLTDGATNVTLRDSTVHRLYGDGAVQIAGGATVNGLRLERVTMDNANGDGNNHYYGLWADSSATLTGLVIRDSTFTAFPSGRPPLQLQNLKLNGALIEQNVFSSNKTGGTIIQLGVGAFGSKSYIRNNLFDNGTNTVPRGITVSAGLSGNTPNPIVISDNSFLMFSSNTIQLTNAGAMRVERNIFGPNIFGGDTPADETGSTSLVYNTSASSNGGISTYYPSTAAIDAVNKQLTLTVTKPTSGVIPTDPVTIDVYFTPANANDARLYVGRAENITGTTTLTMPWTLTGGKVRVQTIDAAGRSSQYSRSFTMTASADVAGPNVTINQAPGQADPTTQRDIQFVVTMTETVSGLSASSFIVSGTAPGARIVDLRQVGRDTYVVTTRVNGNGTVSVTLPAGAVTDGAGQGNTAATSTDNTVTFSVPYTVGPVTGRITQTECATYPITRTTSIPDAWQVPTDPVTVTPSFTAPFPVTLSPNPVVFDRDQTTATVSVCAEAGASVTDGSFSISHTTSSRDVDFDELTIGSVTVPTVDMTPRWTMALTASPVSGAAVAEAQPIAYTYTATHVRGYATALTPQIALADVLDDAAWKVASATLMVNGVVQPGTDTLAPDSSGTLSFPAVTLDPGTVVSATFEVTVADVTTTTGNHTLLAAAIAPTAPYPPSPCDPGDLTDTSCWTASHLIAATRVAKTGPATVTAGVVTDPGLPAPATDPATVTPGTITWAYTVTNVGSAPLSQLAVTDDHGVVVTCPSTDLGAGASMQCYGTGTVGAVE